MRLLAASSLIAVSLACKPPPSSLENASTNLGDASAVPAAEPATTPQPTAPSNQPATTPAPSEPATVGASSIDSPYISRSAGPKGGVIIMWPRVAPKGEPESGPVPQGIQTHTRQLVEQTLPGRKVEVRPEPERTCRRAGCDATSVAVLLLRRGEACAVVAVVSPPGKSQAKLIPWAGRLTLKRSTIAFRDPPESEVTITDFARCDSIIDDMKKNDSAVANAINAAAP